MRLLVEAANGAVAVEDGLMAEPSGRFDHILRVPEGEIRPGLINSHDHLHRNHYGRLGIPPYANAYQWAGDIQSRYRDAIAEGQCLPRRAALLKGAWKNLLSGVTHAVHHDAWEPDFESGFPLTVIRLASADSLGMAPNLPPAGSRWTLHVAEGVDAVAAGEVHRLAECGRLDADLIAVHAVGPDADGMVKLRRSGCILVWCPSSNQFLFGRTAPPALLAEGVDVLLGTDSHLTGAGDLLDELRFARKLNLVSGARLEDAVGRLAAHRLGLSPPSLDPGQEANFAVFRKPLLDAAAGNVALVVAAGVLRVMDPLLIPAGLTHGRIVQYRNLRRWIDET